MNLYAKVRHNPEQQPGAAHNQLADEVIRTGNQILLMLSMPAPSDVTALMFYASALKEVTKKKVAELVASAIQLQEQKTKPSLAGEGFENKGV